MRVGVHLQSLRPGEIGGLEGYVRNLVARLPAAANDVELVLFGADYNLSTFSDGDHIEKQELSAAEFSRLDAADLAAHHLDLWFCPLLTLEPSAPGLPSVVTVPDLQHEEHPEFFSRHLLEWRRQSYARTAAVADRLLTFSEYSRREIIERLGADGDRVVSIPLDAAPTFDDASLRTPERLREVAERYGLPPRFFLYPANNWPHKNHTRLLEALALFRERGSEPPVLVLTGADLPPGSDLAGEIARLGLRGRVLRLGYVPEDDLPALYSLAVALVFPSLFEGFGIPLIEAMRSDCPVLCSETTSLPEVGGEAPAYFDPRRPAEIFERMREALVEPEAERRQRITLGRRQAARFSWDETAAATLSVFRQVARSPAVSSGPGPEPPLISIITPSFEQAPFLERTLRSVLEQDYPRLEHIVVDGGSRDGSLEILRRYQERYPGVLRFVSEPDRGQAHAVNKGLALARGEIIGWLNSDDTYRAGALKAVAEAFAAAKESAIVYGRASYVNSEDRPLGPYPTRDRFDWAALAHACYLCQPAVFFRRDVVEAGHRLDETLQCALDYDFWIRLGRRYDFHFIDRELAGSRMYPGNKTLRLRRQVFAEIFAVVRRHYGFLPASWSLGCAHELLDGGDFLFDPRPISWRARALSWWQLLRCNGPGFYLGWRRGQPPGGNGAAALARTVSRALDRATFGGVRRLSASGGASRIRGPRKRARSDARDAQSAGWEEPPSRGELPP